MFFLGYTLLLQSKATQTQADALKIEADRERRSLLPIFKAEAAIAHFEDEKFGFLMNQDIIDLQRRIIEHE